jgi:hypothetical protein
VCYGFAGQFHPLTRYARVGYRYRYPFAMGFWCMLGAPPVVALAVGAVLRNLTVTNPFAIEPPDAVAPLEVEPRGYLS